MNCIERCENFINRYFALLDTWKAKSVPDYETMVMPLDEYYDFAKTKDDVQIRDNRTGYCVIRVRAKSFAAEIGLLLGRYMSIYYGREP